MTEPPTDPAAASPVRRVTSAGGVIVGSGAENRGCVVIVRQKGNSWSLPKGHVNDGEDLFEAALREIREETGLAVLEHVADLTPYDRSGDRSAHVVKRMVLFLFRAAEARLVPEDPDNPEALWLPPQAAVERLSHPRDQEFLADVVRTWGL